MTNMCVFSRFQGCFRHNSVILLNTSPTQALAVSSNGDVTGTGRRFAEETTATNHHHGQSLLSQQFVRFRVIKVAEGVRMFQCERDPRRFLRIKDGQCDGLVGSFVYDIHLSFCLCLIAAASIDFRRHMASFD